MIMQKKNDYQQNTKNSLWRSVTLKLVANFEAKTTILVNFTLKSVFFGGETTPVVMYNFQ